MDKEPEIQEAKRGFIGDAIIDLGHWINQSTRNAVAFVVGAIIAIFG